MIKIGRFVTTKRWKGTLTSTPVMDGNGVQLVINGAPQWEDTKDYVYDLVYYTPSDVNDLRIPVMTVFDEATKIKLVAAGHEWEEL